MNLRWFSISARTWRLGKLLSLRLWNLFNRCAREGHYWGFGVLQINGRHLFYVGHSGIGLLFFGKPGQYATWREQAIMALGRVYLWLKAGEKQAQTLAMLPIVLLMLTGCTEFHWITPEPGTVILPTVTATPEAPAPTIEAQVLPEPTATPCEAVIKGNINAAGEKIAHSPGQANYENTEIDPARGEKLFCTLDAAIAEGWRPAQR